MKGGEGPGQPEVKGGKRGNLFRRLTHVMLSLGIIYYWLPDPLWTEGVPKWTGLLAAVFLACLIEFARMKHRKLLTGMRAYEERRVGGYLYAVIGMAIVLWISPDIVGIPCIIGMACCDPIAGELRWRKIPETRVALLAAVVYALIAFSSLSILETEIGTMILLIATLTPIAILSEQIDIQYLDDDLTMLVFPAIAGTLLLRII
jgi:hypothetical protein